MFFNQEKIKFMDNQPIPAKSLAEGFSKARHALSDYTGLLSFENITAQNSAFPGNVVIIKMWPDKQPYNVVYIKI
jgi:hypothetical protein